MKYISLIMIALLAVDELCAQEVQLIGVELAKAPSGFKESPPYNFGTKLTFFVKDTAVVTGLTTTYDIDRWVTDIGQDLHQEHQKLAVEAVQNDYRITKDTALLSERGFWPEHGKGFVFKLHSWALPDSATTSMSIKAEVEYTVLAPDEVLIKDITHLAGNIEGLTGLEFMGNSIELKPKVHGQGTEAYMTFNGTVTNKTYQVAIKTMQFLDNEGKMLDELYFGLNNTYNTSTRNRVDLRNATIVRMHYRRLKNKKVIIDEVLGLGF